MQLEPTQRPLGELFSELAQETGTLIRKEVELAKTEMTAKAREATKDITRIAIGGVIAFIGTILLSGALIILLDHVMPLWAAALLVGLVVSGAGATLALSGKAALKKLDAAPRLTLQTLKEDKQWLREQAAR